MYKAIVKPATNEFMGKIFEEMSKQYLERQNLKKALPFVFFEIGRWWANDPRAKKQIEIDIVASFSEEKKALFCECKYKNSVVDEGILKQLIKNSEVLKEYKEMHYILFSKTGFTKSVEEDPQVQCVSLAHMYEEA